MRVCVLGGCALLAGAVAAAGTSRHPSTVALSRRRPSGLSPDSASSQARLNDSVARSHSIAQQLRDEAASHDNHRTRVKRHARLARQRGARSRDEMGVKHGHVGTHPHTTVLLGGIVASGQYYIEAYVGVAPRVQRFTLQVDTGSTVIALPARQCTDCVDYVFYPLQPNNTLPTTMVTHDDPVCCRDGPGCRSSKMPGGCSFSLSYGDHSGADGVLVRDVVTIANITSPIIFGAILEEHGAFETSKNIDGILGMAPANVGCSPTCVDSLIGQLRSKHLVSDQFSMCLGPRGGAMTLGGVDRSLIARGGGEMDYVPLLGGSFYSMLASEVRVGGKLVSQEERIIVDSGTTLLLLHTNLWQSFVEAVLRKCPLAQTLLDRFKGGHCVAVTVLARACFPPVSLVLSETLVLTVGPDVYLMPNVANTSARGSVFYCLGIGVSESFHTLLGDVVMQQYLIDFDHSRGRIGFAPRNVQECGGSTSCEQAYSNCTSCARDAACFWCPQSSTCANVTQVTRCGEACKGEFCECQHEVLWTLWFWDIGLLACVAALLLGSILAVLFYHGAALHTELLDSGQMREVVEYGRYKA